VVGLALPDKRQEVLEVLVAVLAATPQVVGVKVSQVKETEEAMRVQEQALPPVAAAVRVHAV
jgi:hypothetical protein